MNLSKKYLKHVCPNVHLCACSTWRGRNTGLQIRSEPSSIHEIETNRDFAVYSTLKGLDPQTLGGKELHSVRRAILQGNADIGGSSWLGRSRVCLGGSGVQSKF